MRAGPTVKWAFLAILLSCLCAAPAWAADVAASPPGAAGGDAAALGPWWLPLILLVPGIAGLWMAAVKDALRTHTARKLAAAAS